jgi:hypothetical protein
VASATQKLASGQIDKQVFQTIFQEATNEFLLKLQDLNL